MKKNYLAGIATILSVLAGGLLIILFIYFGMKENITVYQERQNTGYQQIEKYSCHIIEDKVTPIGIKKEYRWNLESTPKGDTCLAFYVVHQYVEVSIDGKVVYTLAPSEQNQISKTVGSNWVMIPLYQEDTGKEICVTIVPVYENCKDKTIDFLIGSQLKIYLNRLTIDLPQLILGVMAILVGIIFIGFACHNFIRNRKGSSLASLGLFSVMMGMWRLTDTRTTPFLFSDKPTLLFYISVAMVMIGMVPLIRAMKNRFTKNVSLLLDGCCMVDSLVCLIQVLLQILHIADFRENLTVTHIIILINVLVLLGSILYEKLRFKKRRKGHLGRKLSLICAVGVVADLIAYYLKGNSSGLLFTLSGFLIYIIIMGIVMIIDYKEQEKKLKEQEEELASSRIAILLSQIQPHFIFNSLAAIETLCKKNADEAVEALEHFSGYLRGSMVALTEKKQIRFESELNHVKNYLYMEQRRFGNRLQVEYDIQETGFLLPSLTVQPMVENAVRHGICKKIEGGCVRIKSFADEENWTVEILDDGIGFDMEEFEHMGGIHVGIANVRSRLKMMCDGRIEINSVKGKGTKVCIMIPKK